MKRIGQEYEVHGLRHELGDVVGIGRHEVAVGQAAFSKARAGRLDQRRINIDCRDVPRDVDNVKREPTIAGAQINNVHAGCQTDRCQHTGRIGP